MILIAHTTGLNNYDGLILAYGYPYENYRLNKITLNGLFIWKVGLLYYYIFINFNAFTIYNNRLFIKLI